MKSFWDSYPDADGYLMQWILDYRYLLGMCRCGCGRYVRPPVRMTAAQGMAVAMITKGVY